MKTKEKTLKMTNVKPYENFARDFDISLDKIRHVYSGVINRCTCGCEGDYFYTQHYATYRLKTDGNELLLPMTSEKQDLKILKMLERAIEDFGDNARWLNLSWGGYQITIPTYAEKGFIIELDWKPIK